MSLPGLDPTKFNPWHVDQRARPVGHVAILTVSKCFTYKML